MPTLTVNGETFEVEAGKRLVLAIEETGTNIGHRCGGFAKCTTCRVEFTAGEPDVWTKAEYEKLESQGNVGNFRLSCQHVCDHDMSVKPLMTVEEMGWDDPGPAPETTVTPEAEWYAFEEVQESA